MNANEKPKKKSILERLWMTADSSALGKTKVVKKIADKHGFDNSVAYVRQFSVIIPCFNTSDYLVQAIESVIVQTAGFKENIQLILINDGSPDERDEIVCLKYAFKYPNNIVYRKTAHKGVSAARNLGIELAIGKYIAFLDGDDYYAENFLQECAKFMVENPRKIDFCSTSIEYFDAQKGKHPLCGKIKNNSIIDLDSGVVTSMKALFFAASALAKVRFDEELALGGDFKLVASVAAGKRAYGHVASTTYFYRKRFAKDSATDKGESETSLDNFKRIILCHKYLINDELRKFKQVTKFTQNALIYDLSTFCFKSSDEILNSPECAKAYEALAYCLNNIDDTLIIGNKFVDYWVRVFLLKIKYGEPVINDNEITPVYSFGKQKLTIVQTVWVSLCEERNGTIHFGGYFYTLFPELVGLGVMYKGKDYIATHPKCTFKIRDKYFLGKKLLSATFFDITIPYDGGNEYLEFYSFIGFKRKLPCEIKYRRTARLNIEEPNGQFFIDENTMITKIGLNVLSVNKLEFYSLAVKLDTATQAGGYLESHSDIVKEYINRYSEFAGRRIWVFFDRLHTNDDNGYLMYQYAKKIDNGIEKYFMFSSDAKNWNDVSKDPNVLDYNKISDRVYLFFCEKFISSQYAREFISSMPSIPDVDKWVSSYDIFRTLFRTDECYLAHGMVKDSINNTFSYYNSNFRMFVTNTHDEYNYLLSSDFAYPEGVIKLTGYPRYDYLQNNPQKIILLMPSWDIRLTNGGEREYIPNFKYSNLYKFVQGLISNKELCEFLRAKGYKIYCKLHPLCMKQMIDFYTDYTDIIYFPKNILNQELFEIASLCITDYSSTAFDFASLKKPVLYYQGYDYHYQQEGSYFVYEDNGFGKVCYDLDTLIGEIKILVNNDCSMPAEYKQRADKFFNFKDKNNSKRVYDEIIKLPIIKSLNPPDNQSPQNNDLKRRKK